MRRLTLLAGLTPAALHALSPGPDPQLARHLDTYTAQAVRDWKAAGLAIAVVKDGQVVFAKGYGVRELGKPAPVDVQTLFAIGSTTKAMTAAAIGMLVDEGKLRWDDPVIQHLPGFQLNDPYVTREITIRDLLTHRAGLPNADVLWYETDIERERQLGGVDQAHQSVGRWPGKADALDRDGRERLALQRKSHEPAGSDHCSNARCPDDADHRHTVSPRDPSSYRQP